MTLYVGNKKTHHYFPKVRHIIDDYNAYDDPYETMIVDDHHDISYTNSLSSKSKESKSFY